MVVSNKKVWKLKLLQQNKWGQQADIYKSDSQIMCTIILIIEILET